MSEVKEIWRVEYTKDAYEDQTGKKHWGYIVWERFLVEDTGERFDVDDGYTPVHKNLGKIYKDNDNYRFGIYPETVSYTGGTHIRDIDDKRRSYGLRGYFQPPPYKPTSYVYPDGQGPVERLL